MQKTIHSQDLKQMLDRNADIWLINALDEDQFEREHIPGSISIPSGRVILKAEKILGKDDAIIVYCADPDSDASKIALGKLESLGFSDLTHFPEGIAGWKKAGYRLEGSAHEGRVPGDFRYMERKTAGAPNGKGIGDE